MAIVNGYATLAELKNRLDIDAGDTANDVELESAIQAASRSVDTHTSQHFFKVVESRTLVPHSSHRLKLGTFNTLVSATEVATDTAGDGSYATVWAVGDFQLVTHRGTSTQTSAPEKEPFTQIRAVGSLRFPMPSATGRLDLVRVTGTWGWDAVPHAVHEACLIVAAETFKLRDAPFGVAGFGEFGVVRVRDNPKAAVLLVAYTAIPVG